jgi:hypothetical protein
MKRSLHLGFSCSHAELLESRMKKHESCLLGTEFWDENSPAF